jgi:hypothetical protein
LKRRGWLLIFEISYDIIRMREVLQESEEC